MVKKILPFLILLASFLYRLPYMSQPIVTFHSWKQSDTYAIAQKYYHNNSILNETSHLDCENQKKCLYINSFPIYEYTLGNLFRIFGEKVIVARTFSVIIFLLSSYFLFLLAGNFFGYLTSLLILFIYNFLPFSVYWGAAILPDGLAIMFSLAAFYFATKNKSNLWLTAITLSLSILVKGFFAILIIPVFYQLWKKKQKKQAILLALFSVLPFSLWDAYLISLPSYLIYPNSAFSFSGTGSQLFFNGYNPLYFIRYSNWPLILIQRITEELTPVGFIALLLGVIRIGKKYIFFLVWLMAALLSLIVVANGNLIHEYYQFVIIPVVSVFIGWFTIDFISKKWPPKNLNIFLFLLGLIYFGYFPYVNNINARFSSEVRYSEFMTDVKYAQQLIPKDSTVVIIGDESPTLLNTIDRDGWVLYFGDCKDTDYVKKMIITKVRLGADYVIVQNKPYYRSDDTVYEKCLDRVKEIPGYKKLFDLEYMDLFKTNR